MSTKVERPFSLRHAFAWTGHMPCTGVYRCLHCGHTEYDAHPLDYSSVDRDVKCPTLVSIFGKFEVALAPTITCPPAPPLLTNRQHWYRWLISRFGVKPKE